MRNGYRALTNISQDGGQEVPHLFSFIWWWKSWKNGSIILKINRYYLEINSLSNLNEVKSPDLNLTIEKVSPPNIEISKVLL